MNAAQEQLWDWLGKIVVQHSGRSSLRDQGYAYACPEDFALQHGRWYEPLPRPAGFRRGAPKCCYGNSIVLGAQQGFAYVEGYALIHCGGLVVQHAWNDRDGQALDVTWPTPGLAYLGVEFCLGRADEAMWTGDATVLDDYRRHWPLLRQPWQGEDASRWPESKRLRKWRKLLRQRIH